MAWDYPVFIVAMFVVALGIGIWIMRAAAPSRQRIFFQCAVCGRRDKAASSRQWRYCPNCGTPRDAKRAAATRVITQDNDA